MNNRLKLACLFVLPVILSCTPGLPDLSGWGVDTISHMTPNGHIDINQSREKDAFTDLEKFYYDSNGWLTDMYSITQNVTLLDHYDYDDSGMVRTWTQSNEFSGHDVYEMKAFNYDDQGYLVETLNYTGATALTGRCTYEYNADGCLAFKTTYSGGATEWVADSRIAWSYDSSNRMTKREDQTMEGSSWVTTETTEASYKGGKIAKIEIPGDSRQEFSWSGGRIDAVTQYENSFSETEWIHIDAYEYDNDGLLFYDRYYTTYYSDDMDYLYGAIIDGKISRGWTPNGSSYTMTGPWFPEPLNLQSAVYYGLDINVYRR